MLGGGGGGGGGNLPLTGNATHQNVYILRPWYIQTLDVFPPAPIPERHIPDHTSVNSSRWWWWWWRWKDEKKELRIYVLSIANLQIFYLLNILWLTSSGETNAWSCYCQRKCPSTNFVPFFCFLSFNNFFPCNYLTLCGICATTWEREREKRKEKTKEKKKPNPSSNMLGYFVGCWASPLLAMLLCVWVGGAAGGREGGELSCLSSPSRT